MKQELTLQEKVAITTNKQIGKKDKQANKKNKKQNKN